MVARATERLEHPSPVLPTLYMSHVTQEGLELHMKSKLTLSLKYPHLYTLVLGLQAHTQCWELIQALGTTVKHSSNSCIPSSYWCTVVLGTGPGSVHSSLVP